VSGHTGFAGTGVVNTFTQNNTFNLDVGVGDNLTVGDVLDVTGAGILRTSVATPLLTSISGDLTLNPAGAGNVGIRQGTPTRTLHVQGTVKVGTNDATFTTDAWGKAIELPTTHVIQWLKGGGTISRAIGLTSNDNFYFMRSTADDGSAAPAYDMILGPTGKLGLNTVPSYYADVMVPAGGQNILRLGQQGLTNGFTITTTGSELAYTLLDGNVHIGALGNPNWKFNVTSGTGQLSLAPDSSGVNYINSYISGATGPMGLFATRVFVYNEYFAIETSKTPTSSADGSGQSRDMCYDNNYFYIKTGSGWKRAALFTW
jgi:hypothetical protein